MIEVGDSLAEYQIVAALRRGGMAQLFLGRRLGGTEHVVLKLIRPDRAGEEQMVRMFHDEARVTSRVRHPNVVRVERFGCDRGIHFIALEYVDGLPLSQLMTKLRAIGRDVPVHVAVAIVARAAAGLHAAHEATDEHGRPLNIVHRDVSPQNLLLSKHGQVKVIDFGIAKARGRRHSTVQSALKGKLRYMAPEQAWGTVVDHRADVYALAVVLWELLTGQPLFDLSDCARIIARSSPPDAVPPHYYNSWVSDELSAFVTRALSLLPDDRPPTAERLRLHLLSLVPEAAATTDAAIAELVAMASHDEVPRPFLGSTHGMRVPIQEELETTLCP